MRKLLKSWWIWAIVALAVSAFVFMRSDIAPKNLPGVAEEGIAAPGSDKTVEAASEPPTSNQIEPGLIAPVTSRAEGGVAAETGDRAVTADDIGAQTTAPLTEDGSDDTNSKNEPDVAAIVPALETDIEEVSVAPEVGSADATLETATPEPDPVLPALSVETPPQSAVPEIGVSLETAPMAETRPLLSAASPPLTLAQVLPPGEAPAPDQIAPSFDLVRVAPDGSAVIAGRAAPGANVQVFSGTIPVAEATASARGEFVVFLSAPSDTTLDLQIPATPEGASLVVSQEDIVILPSAPDAVDDTPIVVRRTPDAVQIVQPAAPVVPGNVSLDMVSYTESGAVQLAGRGQPGNVARIYADGVLAGESPIAQGGTWELEISDIAEGRYVLRVDEITPEGDVLSRTESPFQRQFPAANMPESFSQGAKIIVQPGNTLWLMATEAYGNGDAYSQIFAANKDAIRDPDLIYPGQIFSIPRIEE